MLMAAELRSTLRLSEEVSHFASNQSARPPADAHRYPLPEAAVGRAAAGSSTRSFRAHVAGGCSSPKMAIARASFPLHVIACATRALLERTLQRHADGQRRPAGLLGELFSGSRAPGSWTSLEHRAPQSAALGRAAGRVHRPHGSRYTARRSPSSSDPDRRAPPKTSWTSSARRSRRSSRRRLPMAAPLARRRRPGEDEALKRFTTSFTEKARARRDRPDLRPRPRDPADDRHPRAAAQEQPDHRRRAGRRQDGAGRGAGARDRRTATCRSRCKDVELLGLDLGLLQAGASVKGEFENRLKAVIAEVKASPDADHPVHRRGAHADRRRRRGRAAATPPTCSSPRSPAASCARSPRPPGPSTRSTSRRTPRSSAASSR